VPVDVGGRSVHVVRSGSGSPAVIFEAGWGCWSEHWQPVQELAAGLTATYSYDRAGHGASDPAGPWSLEGWVTDLETWLISLRVPGPYLLVAHSYGAHIARAFVAGHRADVVGLVLVDAAHEDLDDRLPARYRQQLADFAPDVIEPSQRAKAAVRQLPGLGDLPLSVITHSRADWIPEEFGLSPTELDEAEDQWQRHQRLLAELSSRSTLRVAETSGHMIPFEQPELIAEEIGAMISGQPPIS
jgi:pimeloyl-ACP methyl ester carboxylesterase